MSDQAWKIISLLIAAAAIAISGLAIVDGLTPKTTDGLIWRLGQQRVIVEGVIPGGPGEMAGIQDGDVILGIDHFLVKKPSEAASILIKLQPGLRVPYLIERGGKILTLTLTPNIYRTGDNRLLYRAIVGFVFIFVGLYTVLKGTNLPSARLFYLMSACFLLVLTCSFHGSPYYWIDLIIQNVASWGLTLLGPLFLHFFLIFPIKKRFLESYSALLPVFYLIPLLQHLLFTLSQYFVAIPFPVASMGTSGFIIFGVHIELWVLVGVYMIAGVCALVHSFMHSSDPLRQRQIKMLVWGTLIGLIPFMTFSVIGAGIFGEAELFSIGVLPLMAIPLSFAYSIIRYRLLDIQIIIKRSILYSTMTGLFIGVYMVIVNVVGGWVEQVSPFGGSIFGILFVLLIAISFEPTRSRLQTFINRLFYKSDYQRQATLSKLTETLRTFMKMEELAYTTLEAINSLFSPKKLSLSVISDKPAAMEVTEYSIENGKLKTHRHSVNEDESENRLNDAKTGENRRRLKSGSTHIGGVDSSLEKEQPDKLELPIFSHQKIVGLLSLDSKESGVPYSLAELEALEKFSNQAGLAIENLQLIKSIFNANQRLYETEKLVSLGQLASGVAHEIRNPLSSIKMNIQGLTRSLDPDKTNRRRFEIIQKEIDHLDHIVHDVLIYARPSRLKIEPVQIREIILQALELFSLRLKECKCKVSLLFPDNLPPVLADRDKLHQIVKNIIDNASETMRDGGFLEISCQHLPSSLEVHFKDNGSGIKEDIINSIFNPFFTTKADGTGLGLANVRKFIQEMGGDIAVTSTEGEGADFIITLPLIKEKLNGVINESDSRCR